MCCACAYVGRRRAAGGVRPFCVLSARWTIVKGIYCVRLCVAEADGKSDKQLARDSCYIGRTSELYIQTYIYIYGYMPLLCAQLMNTCFLSVFAVVGCECKCDGIEMMKLGDENNE